MAAAALSLMGSVTTGDIQTQGLSTIQRFLRDGYPIGRIGFLFLCGALPLPIPPFSTLGEYGVNLMAGGGLVAAGTKSIVQMAMTVAHKYAKAYYPSMWPLIWITRLSPWFIFDILQTMSPAFALDGYKYPFMKPATGRTPIAAAGGVGKINMITIPVILGLFALGSYNLLQLLPASITGAAKPVLDIITIVIGSASALSLGGIGGAMVIPQVLAGLRQSGSDLKAAVVTAPVEAASGPTPGPQTGGGSTAHTGSQMPALREIAGHLLGPSEKGDYASYTSGILSGGGGDPSVVESLFFWLTLGVVAAGGAALATSRGS